MAKKEIKPAYPSLYGSHAVMVDEDATELLSRSDMVVCVDAGGIYTTYRNRLDNGLADLNRYADRDSWNVGG